MTRFTLLSLLPLAIACADDTPPPAPTKTEHKAPPPEIKEGDAGEALETGTDIFEDDEGWDDEGEDEGDEPIEEVKPTEPYRGPCKIRWSSGTVLRFKYTDTGGTVRIDTDGNGKSDLCGSFEAADGKTGKVKIDEGCNRKTDIEITPKYDEKTNVATATYNRKTGAEKGKREITLIAMPSFSGIDPGYPLQAKRSDVKLSVRKNLVRSASVKEPTEGPPVKLTLFYDAKDRVKRVKEDLEMDGKADRQFDYKYDKFGNVSSMSFKTFGDEPTKGSARIDYSCWPKEPPSKEAPSKEPPSKAPAKKK